MRKVSTLRHTRWAVTDFPESADVRLAQGGDVDAFQRLVERYARRVHDLARRMLGDAQDAEDVSQQAFLNAWRALHRFDPERPFRNWLLRITSNLCRNRLAARGRAKVLPPRGGDEAPPDVPGPAPLRLLPAEEAATPSPVQAAMEALPERYRLPVILHYVHGLPLDAISEITEVPVATVKTHLFRGRAALRVLLLPPETPPPAGGTKG